MIGMPCLASGGSFFEPVAKAAGDILELNVVKQGTCRSANGILHVNLIRFSIEDASKLLSEHPDLGSVWLFL